MNNKYLLFSWLFLCIVNDSFCQKIIRSDTIRIPNTDTTFVKWYRGQNLTDEHIFISGQLCFKRSYFYRNKKGYFGYYTVDKRGVKPKYEEYKMIYFDGTIKEHGILNNLIYNGFRKTYYRNGVLKCDCYFKNGKRDSINQSHYENGQLQAMIIFNHGKENGKELWFYENGQFKGEQVYENGRLFEIISLFDNKGRPLEKGTLKKGNGTLNNYSDEGKLECIEFYKNGRKTKTIKPEMD